MSAPEATMAARMYPSLAQRSSTAAAPIKTEQADVQSPTPITPTQKAAEAVTADSESSATSPAKLVIDLSPDALKASTDAGIPESIRLSRQADAAGRSNANTFAGLMNQAGSNEATRVLHAELGLIANDLGMGFTDVQSFIPLARKFSVSPPSAETLAQWEGMTTDGEKSAAKHALAADPRLPALLKVWNLEKSPQAIRYLARAASRYS